MASTEIILLERVDKLGAMGDVVQVKPGYARNFLFPKRKALRATKENMAYFEAQKKQLQAENDKKRAEAEKLAEKVKGAKVPLIRQASESGQLYGSVAARDIAEQLQAVSGVTIQRNMVNLNTNFKTIGLFEVEVALHPEVIVPVTVNIARSDEEAQIQADTGKALIAEDDSQPIEQVIEEAAEESNLEDVLEDSALEAEKERIAAEESEAQDDSADAPAAEEAEESAEGSAEEEDKA